MAPKEQEDSFLAELLVREDLGEGRTEPGSDVRVLLVPTAEGPPRILDVVDGRWMGDLPREAFEVRGVEEVDSVPEFTSQGDLSPSSPRTTVVLRRPSDWTLSVVDRQSGEELPSVTVITVADGGEDPMGLWLSHPERPPDDGRRILVEGQGSPVSIPEANPNGLYWASARGHSWKAFQRNRFQHRMRVELAAAGSMDIRILLPPLDRMKALLAGAEPHTLELVVSGPWLDDRDWTRPITAGPRFHLPKIPVGAYTVRVRRASPSGSGSILASTTAEVVPMETTSVAIDLSLEAPLEGLAKLSVVLVAPQGRAVDSDWSVSFWRREESTWTWRFSGNDPLAAWTELEPGRTYGRLFDGIDPGEYVLQVRPTGFQQRIACLPGRNEAILDCSATSELVIHVEGAEPKEVVDLLRRFPQGAEGVGLGRVRVRPDQPTTIRCPSVPVHLQAIGSMAASDVVEIVPEPAATTSVTLTLEPSNLALVQLTAWRDGSHAGVDSAFWSDVSVEPIGHDGRLLAKRYGRHGASVRIAPGIVSPDWSRSMLVLSPPGRYRLTLPGGAQREIEAPPGLSDLPLLLE